MAIIEMKKLLLIGMEGERDKILKSLQKMGNVEIAELDEGELDDYRAIAQNDDLEVLYEDLSKVQFAIDFLTRHGEVEKGMFQVPEEISYNDLSQVQNHKDIYLRLVDECMLLDRRLNEIITRTSQIQNAMGQYEGWTGLDIPLDNIGGTRYTTAIIGSVPNNSVHIFEEKISKDAQLMHIERVGSSRDEANYFVIYHKASENKAQILLREFGFSDVTFEDVKGTPKSIIQGLDRELVLLKEEESRITKNIQELTNRLEDVKLLYDSLMIEIDRIESANRIVESDKTFFLRGWVPSREVERVRKNLDRLSQYIYMEFQDVIEGEDFPVELDNSSFVEPFEVITNLYSTPNARELDPNVYMAPFYTLFFGMMVGDAAYGVIMAIICAYLVKKLKWRGDTKKLGLVIAFGGISTAIWGVLFGSWFGNAGELMGISPVLLSPLDQPLEMLVLCFGLGVVHLFAGMAVKAYANIKKGNIWAAVFDQGFWYVLLIGLILMLAKSQLGIGDVGKYMSIAGSIGLILTQGRHQKGIFKKLTSGILSLYDVTGFLSDVLSYSRLFALGLTTGIIGTVINEIGIMFGKTPIGWILAAGILVVGHIFNILINSIGAYVHSSRLQYIEFFGKFFQGGGQAFKPLKIKTKYTQVYDEEAI